MDHKQDDTHDLGMNPWAHTPMRTPMGMSGMSMPRLETMQHENEVGRLQTELSQLERHFNYLETELSKLGRSDVRTPRVSPADSGHGRLLDTIPKGRPEGNISSPIVEEGNPDQQGRTAEMALGQAQVRARPFTSTPKAAETAKVEQTAKLSQDKKVSTSETKQTPGVKIKPATFDGSGSWLDYKAHFDVCAELNGWSDKEKGMYLAVSLRGQAQGVFGNIGGKSSDYLLLVAALEERFAPPNQTELYRVQLRERRQKASETLSELGQDIRRLTNLAYPTAPSELKETLAKEQFIDALANSDMRLRIKQSRPLDLNDAVRHAVELEAFNRAERKHLEGQGYMRCTSEKTSDQKMDLSDSLKALQKSSRTVTVQQDDHEEWDKDPEISLEGDQRKEENVKGRLFRKSTEPMPVMAPKRIRTAGCFGARGAGSSASATETYGQVKVREDSTKAKESVKPTKPSENKTSAVPEKSCVQRNRRRTGDVCVIVRKDSDLVSQEIIVHDNGQLKHKMFDTMDTSTQDEKIEPSFDFSSWFPVDAVIRPQDIKCRRVLDKEGGKISIEFQYESK